ncbi:MAG: hypothetical protein JJ913_01580 [Rhizobiaceae bacterium]|nr:hypothetical protein [Rhizobiaceae bacterium]
MPGHTHPQLRGKLAGGDRKEVGAAASVAREVLDDPGLVRPLVDCLEDGDAAVVSHAAHAVMQVGRDEPNVFAPHADRLIAILRRCSQWEIGEQLPKVLAAVPITDDQTQQLADILVAQTGNPSNIAAASALSGLAELATTGRIDAAIARDAIERALASPRKALAARARRIEQSLGPKGK